MPLCLSTVVPALHVPDEGKEDPADADQKTIASSIVDYSKLSCLHRDDMDRVVIEIWKFPGKNDEIPAGCIILWE